MIYEVEILVTLCWGEIVFNQVVGVLSLLKLQRRFFNKATKMKAVSVLA